MPPAGNFNSLETLMRQTERTVQAGTPMTVSLEDTLPRFALQGCQRARFGFLTP